MGDHPSIRSADAIDEIAAYCELATAALAVHQVRVQERFQEMIRIKRQYPPPAAGEEAGAR